MANRSSTTRRLTSRSAESSAVSVYPTGNGYVLYGAAITSSTIFNVANIQFQQPGVSLVTSSLNPPVVQPIITNVAYTDASYTIVSYIAATPRATGGIRVFGSNFLPNANVYLAGNVVSTVYINSGELRTLYTAGIPSGTANTLMVFNSNVSGAVYYPGIVWRDTPTFTIGSNLGFTPFNTFYSNTITVTGSGTSFSVVTGTLPTNVSLNSTTGVISGAVPTSYGPAQQSTFTVRATDVYGLTTDQPFTWMVGYYPVNYFVVAGGGGGASSGGGPYSPAPGGGSGGGGAGGLLTGQTVLGYGLPYTITVGAGGIAGPSASPINFPGIIGGGPGWSSNIYQSSTAVVTTSGGGGGGKMTYTPVATDPSSIGGQGGSGGGGGAGSIAAPGGLATGSPAINISGTQGYPGGLGASTVGGGGGGGAAGAGGGGSTNGGNRGLGLPAAQFGYPGGFAYGGHGGSPTYNGFFDNLAGTFTGNAGYGAAGGVQVGGGAGAAGTIILAIPTTYYPGSAPGATVTTLSGNTVLRYNTSTTFTA